MARPSAAAPEFDDKTPWGCYQPSALISARLVLSHLVPRVCAPLTKFLRRPIKYGMTTPLDLEIWGLRLRLLPRGNISEEKLYTSPSLFDGVERRIMADRLDRGGVFVDIGANAGVYSFWAHHCMSGDGRIVSVEPDPEMARRIAFNIATNNVTDIDLCPFALSDREGTAELLVNPAQRGTNTLEPEEALLSDDERVSTTVSVMTLEELLLSRAIQHVDVLKIDVEGHERAILAPFFENAASTLWPRIVICEYKADTEEGIDDILTSCGYKRRTSTKLNAIFERD